MINYDDNNYLDQYRFLKLFSKDYVGESLLSFIITYDKIKINYPIQKTDLRFQIDHRSPKKTRFIEENVENPVNTDFYKILKEHIEIKMISDGITIISVEVI